MAIPNTTLLQHLDEGSELVTLTSLWRHCLGNQDDIVVYLHSKGSFHPSAENDQLRRFITRGALSPECASLPSTCDVCASRMSPVPHPHTSGNMFLARCSYVSRLMAPDPFRIAMTRIARSQGVREGELPCRGMGRFAAEHWVYSHPDVRPCDLYPDPAYVWRYFPVPSGDFERALSAAPRFNLTTYIIRGAYCSRGHWGQRIEHRLDEYLAVYNMTPTPSWWGWKLYAGFGRQQALDLISGKGRGVNELRPSRARGLGRGSKWAGLSEGRKKVP